MFIVNCSYWCGYATRNKSNEMPVSFGKDIDKDYQNGTISDILVYDLEDGKDILLNHFYQLHLEFFKKNGKKKYIIVDSLTEPFQTFVEKLSKINDIHISEKNDSYRLEQKYEGDNFFDLRISYTVSEIFHSKKVQKNILDELALYKKKIFVLENYKIINCERCNPLDISD